jgi:hypothetical protein
MHGQGMFVLADSSTAAGAVTGMITSADNSVTVEVGNRQLLL